MADTRAILIELNLIKAANFGWLYDSEIAELFFKVSTHTPTNTSPTSLAL